jgi:hypothetical protein
MKLVTSMGMHSMAFVQVAVLWKGKSRLPMVVYQVNYRVRQ